MAFDHFAKHKVDIAIIEVGLGGRLDSTNVINPELSIITNISYDHMLILGSTLPQIAFEKAGIIKKNTSVIIGQLQEEVKAVFWAKAKAEDAPIRFASEEWKIIDTQIVNQKRNVSLIKEGRSLDLTLDLTGSYQLKNLKSVLCAVEEINKKGFDISDDAVKKGLSEVKNLTGLMGRWQILFEKPLIVCDTGHNEDGINEVLKNIQLSPHQNLLMVIGMVKDKDISKILSLLPKNAKYFFCAPDMPRAKPAKELQVEAASHGLMGEAYESIATAVVAAKKQAESDDLIFIGGSTFVVAEVV
jgi:dihydrofolate synthase / folylpolyglutamate synthase